MITLISNVITQILKLRLHRLFTAVMLVTALLFTQQLFAQDAEEFFNRGHKFYLSSNDREAEVEFRKALELNPKLSDAYYYLGSIYFKQNQYNKAVAECKQAVRITPRDLKSLIVMGICYKLLGLYEKAIDVLSSG